MDKKQRKVIEKEKQDVKPTLVLNSASNKTSNRVTKRKTPVTNNRRLHAQQIKVGEDSGRRYFIKYSGTCYLETRIWVETLFLAFKAEPKIPMKPIRSTYLMRRAAFSPKRCFRLSKVSKYQVLLYTTNPEKKIPSPLIRDTQTVAVYTPEQVQKLIKYINQDKMSVTKASKKADMTLRSARYYHAKYLKDLNHAIPVPKVHKKYTQDKKNELIGSTVFGKMTIRDAAKKVNMSESFAYHYHKRTRKQYPDISVPRPVDHNKYCTQIQINTLMAVPAFDYEYSDNEM